MQISRRKRSQSFVEASSLSDILFFLLLFFLMISTMASPDAIKLFLPQSTTAKHIPKGTVSLSMNAQKQFFVSGRPVAFEELEQVLTTEAQKKDAETVVLRMDKTNNMQDLAQVYDVITKLNLKMVMATDRVK
ncbi:MAG: biopolymer transporter ExbD [Spirosomataceae bacterium]